MNKTTDNGQDRALQAAMQRRAAQVPPLADDFVERVMAQMNARRQCARRYRLAASITSIAAAVLIAFLLWPESNEDTMTQPEQPVLAEVTTSKAEPKENDEAEVPAPLPQIVSIRKHVVVTPKPRHTSYEKSSAAEPVLAEVESASSSEKESAAINVENDLAEGLPLQDSFVAMNAQVQDIRRRGERLQQMIDVMISEETVFANN